MICPHCNRYAPDGNYKCPGCGKIIKADTDLIEKYQAPEPTGARKKVRTNPTTVILIVVILGGLGILANLMLKHKEKVKTQPLENQAIVETQQPAETASVQDEPVETGDLPQAPPSAQPDSTVPESASSAEPPVTGDMVAPPPSAGPGEFTHQPGQEINIENFALADKMVIFDFYSEYCSPCRKLSPLLDKLDEKRSDIVVYKINVNRPGIKGIDWGSPVIKQYRVGTLPYFVIYLRGRKTREGNPAYQRVIELLQGVGIR